MKDPLAKLYWEPKREKPWQTDEQIDRQTDTGQHCTRLTTSRCHAGEQSNYQCDDTYLLTYLILNVSAAILLISYIYIYITAACSCNTHINGIIWCYGWLYVMHESQAFKLDWNCFQFSYQPAAVSSRQKLVDIEADEGTPRGVLRMTQGQLGG